MRSAICSDESDSISDSISGIAELGDIYKALEEADEAEKMWLVGLPRPWKGLVLSLFLFVLELLM